MCVPTWLLKVGFHLLYYQLAWTYDSVAWSVSLGQWAAWRRLALPFLRPGSTLEVAYGTGGLFIDMVEAGHKPIGIDLSPYMARLASKRLRRKNYALRLSRGQAQALPFPTNYFDNVVATFPADYMLQNETLAEIYRVLKKTPAVPNEANPPGRLVIVAEGELRGPWPIRPIIDWLYRITEQRSLPLSYPINLLISHNFAARWERIEQGGLAARLVIGDKQGEAN